MAGAGRNDPCPCGSGKKFKHCCLARPQTATGITPRDRTEAFDALLKFSRRDEFDTRVVEAAREWADLPDATMPEALEAILQFPTSAGTFFDWLFFDVPPSDGGTIAGAFLDARAWTVSPRAADYIRVMLDTHLRLYQIRSVRPGAGFTIRDLWTKDDVVITERLGSTQLVKWDVLAARVHTHTDASCQLEGAMMALPPAAAKPLLKELKAEHKAFTRWHRDATLAEFFKASAPLIHDVWLEEVALREPPTLVTTEGDPITSSTVVFDVPKAGDALVRVLREPDFAPGTIGHAVWLADAGKRQRILGDVECNKGTLTLTTFSKERAVRGRARLEEILGPFIVRSDTHQEFDPKQARDFVPPLDHPDDLGDIPELKMLMEEFDRAWLDAEVPALDGRTPRQAARDKRLRPRLRALMIDIENQDARMNTTARDFTWMWRELGLRRP